MKSFLEKWLAFAMTGFVRAAMAQSPAFDPGKQEFSENCASCHGLEGKGNGPLGEWLRKSPLDLTLLAKQNNGVLPTNRLYAVVEALAFPATNRATCQSWAASIRSRVHSRCARREVATTRPNWCALASWCSWNTSAGFRGLEPMTVSAAGRTAPFDRNQIHESR